ncbi:MAG: respiratory nitrate reductase subunit gamma [Candidatus Thermoplasmatota archaeon]|nr:respiratory nitrate reductase subunit gamma [Candidatus Thermoplasmatota archaeon]
MAVQVDSHLMTDLKKMGAFDISACYNCGNCTAICPLSVEGHELPRKLIRYAILGLKDKIVSCPEVWLCYFCGECSTSCPRTADPGQFMMSARRYAIRRCSFGRVADAFYSSKLLSLLALSVFPLILLGIFATSHGPIITDEVDMWSFIPMDLIHELGLIVMAFLGLSVLANLFIMYRNLSRAAGAAPSAKVKLTRRAGIWLKALITIGIVEVLAQRRFTKCDDNSSEAQSKKGTYKYWAHMAVFWGFLGLAGATLIDYGINEYGLTVSRDISRVLGIVSGIVMMIGAAYFIYKRVKKDEVFSTFSHFSDWIFLILLFFGGLTGFMVTSFLYAGMAEATYISLVIHLMFSFDLLITLPFTKFAHAMYRPFALWIVTARDQVSAAGKTT